MAKYMLVMALEPFMCARTKGMPGVLLPLLLEERQFFIELVGVDQPVKSILFRLAIARPALKGLDLILGES